MFAGLNGDICINCNQLLLLPTFYVGCRFILQRNDDVTDSTYVSRNSKQQATASSKREWCAPPSSLRVRIMMRAYFFLEKKTESFDVYQPVLLLLLRLFFPLLLQVRWLALSPRVHWKQRQAHRRLQQGCCLRALNTRKKKDD